MIRLIKSFFCDSISWILLLFLGLTFIIGLTTLFERHDKLERYKKRLAQMEYDIILLNKDLELKKEWITRLDNDPMAWEQVAREKMNYLGPDEILVTFVPK